jgi:O-antigen/teichoic acid export membrane protein
VWVGSRALGGDFTRFGTAIVVAVALGVVQLFVLPHRLDVTTYGQYRLFLVYVPYLGLTSLGLADGAFVRWAGQSISLIGLEWRRVLRWLLVVQGTLVAIALVEFLLIADPLVNIYVLAFASCALCTSSAALMGYALQAAGDFRSAGLVAVLAPALFVAENVLLSLHTLTAVIAAFVVAWGTAGVAGALRLASLTAIRATATTAAAAASARTETLAIRPLLRIGAPVLGANLAAGISQFADRILVSVSLPMTSMAMYGFASSVTVAAGAATQTLSRVALSHAARHTEERRAGVLGGVYDIIAAGFGVGLAVIPLFEHVVSNELPGYVPALPIVRALVCGSVFWVAIHVVLVGTLQSYGLVRRQFAFEFCGAGLVVAVCSLCLAAHAPLWGVATAASLAAVVLWYVGTAFVRRSVQEARDQRSLRFLLIASSQVIALLVALTAGDGWIRQSLTYMLLAVLPTFVAAHAARRQWRE